MNLSDEIERALGAVNEFGDRLERFGIVEWRRLAELRLLGVLPGEIDRRSALFQALPDGDGRLHVIAIAREAGVPIDYAAIDPRRSRSWARRTGHTPLVGFDALDDAIKSRGWFTEPAILRMSDGPLAWLRAGCEGVALIADLDRETIEQLREVEVLAFDDAGLMRRIDAALREPVRMPLMRMREEARCAA